MLLRFKADGVIYLNLILYHCDFECESWVSSKTENLGTVIVPPLVLAFLDVFVDADLTWKVEFEGESKELMYPFRKMCWESSVCQASPR